MQLLYLYLAGYANIYTKEHWMIELQLFNISM